MLSRFLKIIAYTLYLYFLANLAQISFPSIKPILTPSLMHLKFLDWANHRPPKNCSSSYSPGCWSTWNSGGSHPSSSVQPLSPLIQSLDRSGICGQRYGPRYKPCAPAVAPSLVSLPPDLGPSHPTGHPATKGSHGDDKAVPIMTHNTTASHCLQQQLEPLWIQGLLVPI